MEFHACSFRQFRISVLEFEPSVERRVVCAHQPTHTQNRGSIYDARTTEPTHTFKRKRRRTTVQIRGSRQGGHTATSHELRTKRPTTRRETMTKTALEACGVHVTGILSLAVGHQERVRPLPFLCSLHLIETVDASVILFHDNTESTRHNHCGVT